MHHYDLQPEEEHSIRKYLDDASETKPNPITNAQRYF